MDEQPFYVNREIRDVTNIPTAAQVTKGNVGTTVRDPNKVIVGKSVISQQEASDQSTLFLDINTTNKYGNKKPAGGSGGNSPPAIAQPRSANATPRSVIRPTMIMSDPQNYPQNASAPAAAAATAGTSPKKAVAEKGCKKKKGKANGCTCS